MSSYKDLQAKIFERDNFILADIAERVAENTGCW